MSKPTVKNFFHKDSSTCCYVVYDPLTRDAVVVDSVMDLDTVNWQCSVAFNQDVAAFVDSEHLTLHFVLDTHTHADHITGAAWFRDKYKIPYCIGEGIIHVQKTFADLFDLKDFPCDGSQFDRLLKDNELVSAGSLQIRCLATKGHTPNCLSYLIGDTVFTGDALFMEDFGTGRCDFPGGSAADLYDSVMRLFSLPHDTRVFVGHDYQPGGRELRVESSIGVQREKNDDLTVHSKKEEFVTGKTNYDKTLNLPRLIFPSLTVNMNAGRLPPAQGALHMRYLRIPLNFRGATDDLGEKK